MNNEVEFITNPEVLEIEMELGTLIGDDIRKHYEGPYKIKPQTIDQDFETNEKVMDDDLKVFAIPYYEVTNPSGGKTITIGEF